MITFNEAIKKVESHLLSMNNEREEIIVKLLLEETIDTNDYWVFFYNNAKFLETGNFSYSLIGNAPLIVDKYQGKIYETGTSRSVEFYMAQFEKNVLPTVK